LPLLHQLLAGAVSSWCSVAAKGFAGMPANPAFSLQIPKVGRRWIQDAALSA